MDDINDFEHYKNLIEKEKAEEELFEAVYGDSINTCLLNLNNFSDSSFKINKNISIVGQKDSYKNKFIKILIVHIIYNFFIRQKDAPRILIFFSVKDILNPIHLLSIAEDYFSNLSPLNPKTDKTKYESEKEKFFKYLNSSISLFLISTFKDVKLVLEELHKNDKNNDNSAFMDIVTKDNSKNNESNFNFGSYEKKTPTFLFFYYLSKIDNFSYSKNKSEGGYEKSATQKFFDDYGFLTQKDNYVSFFLEELKDYNTKLSFKKPTYMYNMDTIILFEKNSFKKSLKLMLLKSSLLSEYIIEDFPMNDFFSFNDLIIV